MEGATDQRVLSWEIATMSRAEHKMSSWEDTSSSCPENVGWLDLDESANREADVQPLA
jgi:hypothetical protein